MIKRENPEGGSELLHSLMTLLWEGLRVEQPIIAKTSFWVESYEDEQLVASHIKKGMMGYVSEIYEEGTVEVYFSQLDLAMCTKYEELLIGDCLSIV